MSNGERTPAPSDGFAAGGASAPGDDSASGGARPCPATSHPVALPCPATPRTRQRPRIRRHPSTRQRSCARRHPHARRPHARRHPRTRPAQAVLPGGGAAGAAPLVEPAALAALLFADGYGYDMRKTILERTGGAVDVDVGGLYRSLRRLEEEGRGCLALVRRRGGSAPSRVRAHAAGGGAGRAVARRPARPAGASTNCSSGFLKGACRNRAGARRLRGRKAKMSETMKLAVPTMGAAGLEGPTGRAFRPLRLLHGGRN